MLNSPAKGKGPKYSITALGNCARNQLLFLSLPSVLATLLGKPTLGACPPDSQTPQAGLVFACYFHSGHLPETVVTLEECTVDPGLFVFNIVCVCQGWGGGDC